MNRYANILLASVAAVVLLWGGTFHRSAVDHLNTSSQGSHHSFLGSVYASFSSLVHHDSTLIAAAGEDSEDSTGDNKNGKEENDKEDGNLTELWNSVQLG
jgi:hypothetical protein